MALARHMLQRSMPLLILGVLTLAATGTDYLTTYRATKSAKVIFSKRFFYNNSNANGMGCSGDANIYFDPSTDRQTPTKPDWIRNISVELTNSNSPFNASNTFLCSYGTSTGLSSDPACLGPTPPASCSSTPPPSNCAAFDDMQSLTGYQTKTYLIGGYNCENIESGRSCLDGRISPTIWQLSMNDTSNLASPAAAAAFSRPSFVLPTPNASHDAGFAALATNLTSPLLQTQWAYDEIHDWAIGFGGVVMHSGNAPSFYLSKTLQRLYQKPYPQATAAASTINIEAIDVTSATGTLTNRLTPSNSGAVAAPTAGGAGFREAVGAGDTTKVDLEPPSARLGHTFTYIPRRTPSLARRWAQTNPGSAPCSSTAGTGSTGLTCVDSTASTSETDMISGWNDSDFFVSIGGVTGLSSLSAGVVALMPHRIGKNDGSGVQFARDGMSWEWLSHFKSGAGIPSPMIMPVVDLATDGTSRGASPSNWYHVDRFASIAGRGTAGVFPARAFHRSVYDSQMNRVYIFGGILTKNTAFTNPSTTDYQGYGTVASTANLAATSETWIYDLPNLGQRPTQACRVTKSPLTNQDLPGLMTSLRNVPAPSHVADHSTFDSDNLNYETSSSLSPPGGCMQFAQPMSDTVAPSPAADDGGTAQNYLQPTGRFEHAMAFDEAQGVAIMFGGCTAPPTFGTSGLAGSGPFATAADSDSTSQLPYNPLTNCNNRSVLLNDTWMFIPPDTRESALVTSAAGATQYNVDRPDLRGMDPILLGLPLYFSTATTSSSTTMSTTELQSHTNGTWIRLWSDDGSTSTSTTQPAARASASFWYDKSHQKFYLFGGKACNGACEYLNDLWEFTPPRASQCTKFWTSASSDVRCTASGTWRRIDNSPTNLYSATPSHSGYNWPATTAFGSAVPASRAPGDYNHSGDGYYTVSDNACGGQGPVIGTDATSKQQVGAIYIDIDRSQFSSTENLLINLKALPFAGTTYTTSGADNNDGTKLPGYNFGGTFGATTTDDRDSATSTDNAYIRVTLMANPYSSIDYILRQNQPRYHSYQEPGAPIISEEFDLASNGTGMPTDKQIFVPLSLDARINMIKIERVRGSVKFFDMTVSKF